MVTLLDFDKDYTNLPSNLVPRMYALMTFFLFVSSAIFIISLRKLTCTFTTIMFIYTFICIILLMGTTDYQRSKFSAHLLRDDRFVGRAVYKPIRRLQIDRGHWKIALTAPMQLQL